MLPYSTPAERALWFAGLPADTVFLVAGEQCGVTEDRAPDSSECVAIRFPTGVGRVPLASVREWTINGGYPGGRRR